MKHKLICLSILMAILFFFKNILYGQGADLINLRVNEIEKWYSEIQSIGLINCQSKSFIEYQYSPYPDKKPFNQHVQSCKLKDAYIVKTGNFSGDHWGRHVSIYYKNEKIFFVIEEEGGEGQLYETRYYCDSEEKIIKQLDRQAEGGAELTGPPTENKDNLKKNIHQIIDLKPFKRLEK